MLPVFVLVRRILVIILLVLLFLDAFTKKIRILLWAQLLHGFCRGGYCRGGGHRKPESGGIGGYGRGMHYARTSREHTACARRTRRGESAAERDEEAGDRHVGPMRPEETNSETPNAT